MGWGERHTSGAGTTSQVEAAHALLDGLGVRPGPLADRVLHLFGDAQASIETVRAALAGMTGRVEHLEERYGVLVIPDELHEPTDDDTFTTEILAVMAARPERPAAQLLLDLSLGHRRRLLERRRRRRRRRFYPEPMQETSPGLLHPEPKATTVRSAEPNPAAPGGSHEPAARLEPPADRR